MTNCVATWCCTPTRRRCSSPSILATAGVPNVIRRLAATQPMLDKIVGHQRHIAQAYGISMEHARWLLTTVAFHCLCRGRHGVLGRRTGTRRGCRPCDGGSRDGGRTQQGMHALIVGMLALMDADGLSGDS